MKEKNREAIAEKLYATKELLQDKKEEQARLLSYNPKKAARLKTEIEKLQIELKQLESELREADSHPKPEKIDQMSEKEALYNLLAPLDHYMQQAASALKKRRILLFFARHPKVVLAQMLYLGAEEAKKIPQKMAPFLEGAHQADCKKIELFCQNLVKHANHRWNHALYSGEFLKIVEEWDAIACDLRPDA